MDEKRARQLLDAKRTEIEELLRSTQRAVSDDQEGEDEAGDYVDPAQQLTAEGMDDAIAESLTQRLAALDRADKRLAEGSYGLSVRSGQAIPDARLEADPTAELTIEEAQAEAESSA